MELLSKCHWQQQASNDTFYNVCAPPLSHAPATQSTHHCPFSWFSSLNSSAVWQSGASGSQVLGSMKPSQLHLGPGSCLLSSSASAAFMLITHLQLTPPPRFATRDKKNSAQIVFVEASFVASFQRVGQFKWCSPLVTNSLPRLRETWTSLTYFWNQRQENYRRGNNPRGMCYLWMIDARSSLAEARAT